MASDNAQSGPIGFLVGLKAEADLLRRFFPDSPIAISGATRDGAERGAARLVACGVPVLASFGLAAGLDPELAPGTILVPDAVVAEGKLFPCSPSLRRRLGAGLRGVVAGALLHSDVVVLTAEEKQRLAHETGCCSLDMESGFVARAAQKAGRPFAVLRVICDPASRTLPPAAALALSPDGGLGVGALAKSLLCRPSQIVSLIKLGCDASSARKAMLRFLEFKASAPSS
ncbi:hypothetical protein GOB87_02330 [Acetobacter estunensis]|uniref:Nucleoside phosphorylase domain-containing protein n=1 Tax=Acetobacter estunensis TaxID=104097 RepID=A0A967B4Q6_9PROT|nr:hypothetical protein [Acetobacter estunensis]NHO52800.1 hypothetical protein [Acetobacter estunensis]